MVQVLLPKHSHQLVSSSGIGEDVVAARGYFSATTKAELRRLGSPASQQLVPTLVVPVWSVTGEIGSYQHRPDTARIHAGKPVKYETMAGRAMILDVHPNIREQVGNPDVPLFITEGTKKADAAITKSACCVALLGVWNWRGTNEFGGKTALPDWEQIALKGRRIYIVFDSDVMGKKAVHAALARLKAFLEGRGAEVWLIYLPSGEAGRKTGLDDYLLGRSVDELLGLATPDLRPMEADGDEQLCIPYRATPTGLVQLRRTEGGATPVPLTNFIARIVAEVEEDDGAEVVRVFEMEAGRGGRMRLFTIPSEQFHSVRRWVIQHLGATCVLYAGQGCETHVATAIQLLSGEVPRSRVYKHTGWCEVQPGVYVYLSAGSVVGEVEQGSVSVRLSAPLDKFSLPEPPSDVDAVDAVRASLRILGVAPHALTVPLFAAIWRAALGACDHALFFSGASGVFKSELAALAQQHYGPGLDARNFAASWMGTDNFLEIAAFMAKDALLVIDDYAPQGGQQEQARLAAKADRVLRAQGNNSARGRLNADLTTRPNRPPRGLIVSTGEDLPPGHSLRARNLILEVGRGDVDVAKLTPCQRDAADGVYAQAMSAFLAWVAPQYEALQARRRTRAKELRTQALKGGASHARTPEIVANLAAGMESFLVFAEETGAVSASEKASLWERTWEALRTVALQQGQHHAASEPAKRFLELLRSALASGEAHVAGTDGQEPASPMAWGWRQFEVGTGDNYRTEWRPQGKRVGWLEGNDLYLEPEAAYQTAKRLGASSGEGITIGQRTLNRHLKERGLLLTFEERRGTLTRREVEGKRLSLLHLSSATINSPETAQTAPGVADRDDAPEEGEDDFGLEDASGGGTINERGHGHEPPAAAPDDSSPQSPSALPVSRDNGLRGQKGQFGQFPDRDRTLPELPDYSVVAREEFEL